MRFPYQFFRGYYYPIIPVFIAKSNKEVKTSAIVDSGATISIFNSNVAVPLGLDIKSGKEREFQSARDKLIGYEHKVKMVIGGREVECKIVFSDELGTSFNLLGREGIFDKFRVCFDETEKFVEFASR